MGDLHQRSIPLRRNRQSTINTGDIVNISIIIPVFNEALMIQDTLKDVYKMMMIYDPSFEIIVAENGSTDQTPQLVNQLISEGLSKIRLIQTPEPNYGFALKKGILNAKGRFVICDEIDLCDARFHQEALKQLNTGSVAFVVGSKRALGAQDRRPFFRRFATMILNKTLRILLGFQGTDTHGPKGFCRESLTTIVNQCVIDRDMFASELVIRVHRSGLTWSEIPLDLSEKRPPSIGLLRRVPHVLKSMIILVKAIYIDSPSNSIFESNQTKKSQSQ